MHLHLDSLHHVSDQLFVMKNTPWDQVIARFLVRPLVNTGLRPNHITAVTLIMALSAGILFALNDLVLNHWAAGLFVASRFLDHFDGELARLQGSETKFGYYFDYFVGGFGYAALFSGIGIGHWRSDLGAWGLILGFFGTFAALISLFTNLQIDKQMDNSVSGTAVGYPYFLGFELEDGIYLLAPITWLGYLTPFFIAACIGASIYCFWTIFSLIRIHGK